MTQYLNLFGNLRFTFQGETLEPKPSKPIYLLAYAALSGEWIEREKLAFLFWPDAHEKTAQQNLRRLIYRTKELEFAADLEVENSRLRWLIPTDVQEFKEAMAKQDWQKATHLYKGTFVANLNPKNELGYNAWLEQERSDIDRSWRNAVHKYSIQLEKETKPAEAAGLLKQLIDSEPLAEDTLQRYLKNAYLAGQRDHALKTFYAFRKALHKELELEPLEETLSLVQTIVESKNISLTQTLADSKEVTPQQLIPLTVQRPPKLIGREEAILEIQNASAQTIFVAGEAGIGKSRLVTELAPHALFIKCQEGMQNTPFYPIIQFIRSCLKEGTAVPDLKQYTEDLARLVPEIAPNLNPNPSDPDTVRSRLFEALSLLFESLIETRNLKDIQIFIDDLQWADNSSLDFITYLTTKNTVKLIATYRTHEQTEGLKKVIKSLSASKTLSNIKLEPLEVSASQALLASMMNKQEGPPAFSEWLTKSTGGNPMFMLELLKNLFESGVLQEKDENWQSDIDDLTSDYSELQVPSVIQEIIQRRLDALKPETQRILEVASIISQGFDYDILSKTSGLSEWAVFDALEEAEEMGLIQQDKFCHDLLRQSIYGQIKQEKRNLLHERVASQIEEPYQAAEHWLYAGKLQQAASYWYDAALQLRKQGLLQEAITILKRADSYMEVSAMKWKIRNALATNYKSLAQYDQVEQALRPIFSSEDDEAQGIAGNLLAGVALHRGDIEKANQILTIAKNKLEYSENQRAKIEVASTFAMIYHLSGESQKALNITEPILVYWRTEGDDTQIALALTNKAALLDQLGRHQESLPLHHEALEKIREIGDKARQVDASLNLLYCYMDLDRTLEGLEVAEEALQLGYYEGTDILRNNLAAAYVKLNDNKNAIKHAEILTQDSADPTLCCISWARLAQLYVDKPKIHNALHEAINYAEKTDLAIAHSIMLTSTYKFGDKECISKAHKFLEQLNLDSLPLHAKNNLERAIAENASR